MRLEELTVVVPTKNEAANVGPFLASLDPRVALVVVDASTDDTRERIAALRPERTRVIADAGTIPVARQAGLEVAETEWVLFTDADMSFGPDYWAAWERLRLGARVGAVQGGKYSADGEFRLYYRLFSFGIRAAAWLTVPAGSGSNMVFRRSALLAAGGFDKALTANEDIYALWTVRRAGWRVPYAGGLKVYERDHRRLRQGRARKTLHAWARSVMLMTGLGAGSVRKSSWGYWDDDAPGA
jgi:glycosyltransferase involved in cell wall biosynthesis